MSKKKTVYINGRFLTQPATGVQRYAMELIRALDSILGNSTEPSEDIDIICLVSNELEIKNFPDWKNIQIKKCGCMKGNLWEQIELPLFSSNGLLLNLCNIGPIFHFSQLVVFHDASVFAIPRAYSSGFKLKHQIVMWILARTAKQIITDSQFSRKELSKYLGIHADKIISIPAGCEHILNIQSDILILNDSRLTKHQFLLAVGSSSPHKNINNLVSAMDLCADQSITLVIAGGNFSKVFKPLNEITSQRIIHLGYVTDSELRALYSHAIAFVFPSLYEGFGFPPLEAMSCGCPVISSNKASLPEACGDAVLYFDPENIKSISEKIDLIVGNETLQNDLKQKGLEQIKKFTWINTANRFWIKVKEVV